jgi:16S rRNA processing protein RimM
MAGIMQELLGRIIKIHGCEGAVAVKVEKIFSDNIPEMESVFLEIEGKRVPFFLEHYKTFGQENILFWFQDYTSVEKVREFIGCKVFIQSEGHISKPAIVQEDIIGFDLYTIAEELVGNVIKVTKNPGQWLLTVVSDTGNEILIPFHEDLIISIKTESKKIIMILPDGLGTLN